MVNEWMDIKMEVRINVFMARFMKVQSINIQGQVYSTAAFSVSYI